MQMEWRFGINFRSRRGSSEFVVKTELTGFHFPGDPTVWATTYPAFHNSSEQHYPKLKLSDLSNGSIVGLPLLAEVKPDVYAALAEADLNDWAGMSLTPTNTGLAANLSPRLDGNGPGGGQAAACFPMARDYAGDYAGGVD